MLVKCNAKTCKHNKNCMCKSESIEMIDFEYYADAEMQRREVLDDDMKCGSYKSIYGKGEGN